MTLYIAPIVEGHTESGCVERLFQRIWTEVLVPTIRLQVLPPSRCQRDALLKPTGTELSTKIEEAHAKLTQRLRRDPEGRGLLLLLLDAERDCPARLGPVLLAAARAVRGDVDVTCVLANAMLENWIVAGASTLAGLNGLPDPLPPNDSPEVGSGATWLEQQLRSKNKSRKYKKTVDAEVFVRAMNLSECRAKAPSFDKLCRELQARLPPPLPEPPASDPIPPDPPTE
jgi:hypothetical protein